MAEAWEGLLSSDNEQVLPWTGSNYISDRDRSWKLVGNFPREYGWYRFKTSGGRTATLLGPADPDPDFGEGRTVIKGFLTGDRFIPDNAKVVPDPHQLVKQTRKIYLVEPGLDWFARATAVEISEGLGHLVYLQQEFPEGPDLEAVEAFQDRLTNLNHIKGVTPALDLAFHWLSYWRSEQERMEQERARILEEERQRRAAEDKLREAMKDAGTGAGRRALARVDFNAAARAALAVSGAEFLDARPAPDPGEMIVRYRFRHERLACVVERYSLRIMDAGVCLGHGERKGDKKFTLESLPAVVGWAMDLNRLVIWRHG